MHIRCPHCHNPIEIIKDSSFRDVECPSCGSHFNLVGNDAPTESGPTRPRRLAHFELVEQLGVGHFGAVWKAKDTTLDRFVALKIPRREQLEEEDIEKFFREARAAAQLRHPNIVSVHEVGRESNTIFIASDYVEGATLAEWLRGQPLSPREAAKLCAKIAKALHAAHEAGVVHRDLKPHNIMMDMQDEPHIMDFGLAKRDSGEITVTVEGALLGTPAYMPPEQAAGKGHDADRRSDVYSLGVILYEMLTGTLPFQGEKRMLLVQIQRDDAPSPRRRNATVPRDLETICLKCLEKSPQKRYLSAGDLSDDLCRFLDGQPIKARRIGSMARAWRWAKRNPTVASLATSVFLVLLGGTAGILYWAGVAASERSQAIESLVHALSTASPSQVPVGVDALRPFGDALPMLRQKYLDATGECKLHTAFGLAEFGEVESEFLVNSIGKAALGECDNLVDALRHDSDTAVKHLNNSAEDATKNGDWQLKTRLATVALYMGHTTIATEMLQAEPLNEPQVDYLVEPQPQWDEPPLDPNWPIVNDATKMHFVAAHGIVADRFAYCLDMPWNTFLEVTETLRASYYRPTRVRPFECQGRLLAASVWERSAALWQLDYGLSIEQLPAVTSNAEKNSLVPHDVASYTVTGGSTQYCVLWSEPLKKGELRRVCADMTAQELDAFSTNMHRAGLQVEIALQVSVSPQGERRYACIWSNEGENTELLIDFSKWDNGITRQRWQDISLADVVAIPHPIIVLQQQLARDTRVLPDEQDASKTRLSRAIANYYIDRPSDALRDLEVLIADESADTEVRFYCAVCRAQLGQRDAAYDILVKGGIYGRAAEICYMLVRAWLGDLEGAARDLHKFVDNDKENASVYYEAARVAAQLMRVLQDGNLAEVSVWKEQSLQWLERARVLGLREDVGIETEPDFALLHDDAQFQSMLREIVKERFYAGVRGKYGEVESYFDSGLSLGEQWSNAQKRIEMGFRPAAVACNALSNHSEPQNVVIWQRPRVVIPPRQPFDPVQRTMFIELFPKWSGSVDRLVSVLQGTEKAILRSGLALSLGSIAQPTGEVKQAWEPVLARWYEDDTDNGVHSSCRWALQRWNLPIPRVQCGRRDGFKWYETENGLGMVLVPAGQVEAVPAGAMFQDEYETIRVQEDFWISDREVTADLYLQFLDDEEAERPARYQELKANNRGSGLLPITGVTWNEAVMFCNWLSRQERLGPCYQAKGGEPIWCGDQVFSENYAWELVPQANGYRLPSEAQWEYACRARATTKFAFGDDDQFLDRYAVCAQNSNEGPMPVGEMMCNAWGLFDMHGNVSEWCWDMFDENLFERICLGGSWKDDASYWGTWRHTGAAPDYPSLRRTVGFRVVIVSSSE